MNRRLLLILAAALAFSPAAWANPPEVDGYFGDSDCSALYGAAHDNADPNSVLNVDIYYQLGTWQHPIGPRTYLATTPANLGDGHDFRYPFPLAFKDGQTRTFSASSWDQPLRSGAMLTCNSGGYLYYAFDGLTAFDASKWSQNGSVTPTPTGLTAPASSGGAWISTLPVPDGSSEYEVRMTLNLTASGGTYAAYLRASPDAMSGPSAQGTYYSIELQNPTFSGNACTATLALNKRQAGVITLYASSPVPCHRDTIVRVIRSPWAVGVWVDGELYFIVGDSSIASGKPGVGAWGTPSGNSIARVDLGPLDRTAPSPVNTASVAISALPNRVDVQWDPPADGANGVGVPYYYVYRNGSYLTAISGAELTDATVSPGTSYTYALYPMDYHLNVEPTGASVSVTTPPAGAIDPRQVGLRPTGAYWGAGGEQIDTRSGNLNFTLPLLKAMGRNGSGVPFALSYNSQIWRQEGGRDWKLGHDVGYGVGWRLQAGSITPYLLGWASVHHYTFTDSTGAEYRLDVNTNGLWTSQESVYFRYEPATYRLYFPDGSFWVMGAVAAGTEQDSGTRYPTIMQDTNGNQIVVRYQQGAGVAWPDSSARIAEIVDVRAKQSDVQHTGPWRTYWFTYGSGDLPHLTDVSSNIGNAENYHFTYANQNLYSPFATTFFGGTSLLTQVTVTGLNIGHTMEYNPVSGGGVAQPATSGELTRVIQPNGGWMRWAYRPFTYPGNRSLREIQYRYLAKSSGGSETAYTFSHDDSPSSQLHAWTTLADPTGAAKYWSFFTDTAQWTVGLLSGFEGRTSSGGAAIRTQSYTWAQDSMSRPYLAQVQTTLDPGTGNARTSKTEQLLDAYGNVTQTKLYDYGSLTNPVRTYTNTYLATSAYTSRYMRNRLLTSTVTDGTNTTTLVSNTYDAYNYYPLTAAPGLREHDPAYNTSFTVRGNVSYSASLGVFKSMAYDIAGLAVTTYDAYGRTVSATYSPNTNYAAPDALTPNGESNLSTSYTYSSFLGLTSVTGPNQANSTIAYDTYGRPSSSVSPHGAYTTYAYTYNPSTVTVTTGARVVKTTQDGLGRTIKVETGDASAVQSVVETEYDSCACSRLAAPRPGRHRLLDHLHL
ncbi:MAG: hypothetical protein ABSE56_02780 [Bryobacteraceae bacterium]